MKTDKCELVKIDDPKRLMYKLHVRFHTCGRMAAELTRLKRYKKARKTFKKAVEALERQYTMAYAQKPELRGMNFALVYDGTDCFAAIETETFGAVD